MQHFPRRHILCFQITLTVARYKGDRRNLDKALNRQIGLIITVNIPAVFSKPCTLGNYFIISYIH